MSNCHLVNTYNVLGPMPDSEFSAGHHSCLDREMSSSKEARLGQESVGPQVPKSRLWLKPRKVLLYRQTQCDLHHSKTNESNKMYYLCIIPLDCSLHNILSFKCLNSDSSQRLLELYFNSCLIVHSTKTFCAALPCSFPSPKSWGGGGNSFGSWCISKLNFCLSV